MTRAKHSIRLSQMRATHGDRPTIWDVARAAGVSIATVSNALRGTGRISQQTRNKVVQIAHRLGYVPRPLGPGASSHARRIVLLVEEISDAEPHRDQFIGAVIRGISRIVRGRGYKLEIFLRRAADEHRDRLPETIFESGVRGVIVLEGGDISDEYIDKICSTGLPVVLVDNYLFHRPITCVCVDNLTGAFLAVSHLIRLGHRRIGIVRGPAKYKPLVERYLGYVLALEIHGLPSFPELAPPHALGGRRKGFNETQALLDLVPRPTAIFAVSDKAAVNALAVIRARGLRVPEDIALISFDDLPIARIQDPPLSTVWIPKEELGELAAEKLFHLIDYPDQPPQRIVLPTRLVIRESCGAHYKARAHGEHGA